MAKTVIVASKLPVGLVLEHPMKPEEKVEIKGVNASLIIGATHMNTEVDADFWDAWKAVHGKHFAPYVNGSIFEGKDESSANAAAKERAKVKTGLERAEQSAPGIEKANEKD